MDSTDTGRAFLEEALRNFRSYKRLGEEALAQISDADFFRVLDPESNSAALIVKHMAGNMRSRWTGFLDSDGEKPGRRRDAEFEVAATDTRASLMARWEEGWDLVFAALSPLAPEDLGRTITVRGVPYTVLRAITRQLLHYSYHVGQIVFLGKHLCGARWKSLSIPRGKSEDPATAQRAERERA